MTDLIGRSDLSPERFTDRLVAEADPEERNAFEELANHFDGDPRLFRGARAGRDHNPLRLHLTYLVKSDLIVPLLGENHLKNVAVDDVPPSALHRCAEALLRGNILHLPICLCAGQNRFFFLSKDDLQPPDLVDGLVVLSAQNGFGDSIPPNLTVRDEEQLVPDIVEHEYHVVEQQKRVRDAQVIMTHDGHSLDQPDGLVAEIAYSST